MFTGVWKGGKTSFVAHLLRHMEKSPETEFLGKKTMSAKTFIMTEEPSGFWHRRMELLDFGDNIMVNAYPFPQKPSAKEWSTFLESLAPWLVQNGYTFVIFDSATDILPITNENDSGDVIRSLKPLNLLKKEGISTLMLHHPSKGSSAGDEENIDTSFRGSGAFGGYVENLMTITRPPGKPYSLERTVAVRSRYPGAPEPMDVELKNKDEKTEHYITRGNTRENKKVSKEDEILNLFKSHSQAGGKGMTVKEVSETLKIHRDWVYTVVGNLYTKGILDLVGTTEKGKNGKVTEIYALKSTELEKLLGLPLNQAVEPSKSVPNQPLKASLPPDLDSDPKTPHEIPF